MRHGLITFATAGVLLAMPSLVLASDQGAAAGATAGAVTGAVVGGPVGAAVGAGVGAIAGGAASGPNTATTGSATVIEQRAPTTREQTCVSDAAGNRTCREVVR
jgi:hypothetical protein